MYTGLQITGIFQGVLFLHQNISCGYLLGLSHFGKTILTYKDPNKNIAEDILRYFLP